MSIRNLTDLDCDTLQAGILSRLITNSLERCHVFWLQPSDFTPVAARIFTLVMEESADTIHCGFDDIERKLSRRADFEAVEYLETVVKAGGQPYSVSDLWTCALLLHDRTVIREYNSADGERTTQAWVDSIEASLAYDPEEFEDRPEDE